MQKLHKREKKGGNGWKIPVFNAVIDTNVFVSGLLSARGNSAQIINAMKEKQFNLIYNDDILAEYREVLCREKLGLYPNDVQELLDVIYRGGLSVISNASDIPLIDEDDRIFYDTAKTSDATLVTGNKRHYPNEPFIMSPADFLNMLNSCD